MSLVHLQQPLLIKAIPNNSDSHSNSSSIFILIYFYFIKCVFLNGGRLTGAKRRGINSMQSIENSTKIQITAQIYKFKNLYHSFLIRNLKKIYLIIYLILN